MLSEKLTDFEWFGPAERRLNDIGASGLRRDLGRFMKAGDVQAAAELVLKTMKGENPATRRYIAQTFGIPESTVLVYDEMQRLGKGTTGRSSPY